MLLSVVCVVLGLKLMMIVLLLGRCYLGNDVGMKLVVSMFLLVRILLSSVLVLVLRWMV